MDVLYTNEKYPFGRKPRALVVNKISLFKPGFVLDLGCGSGNEAIYVANKGFNVTAVDFSSVAIGNLKDRLKGLPSKDNIKIIEQDVYEFMQENADKHWDNIISFFTLHFLKPVDALETYKLIQKNTKSGGLNIFRDFTTKGSLNTMKGYYFEQEELKTMYQGWEILVYDESPGLTKDGGKHMIASIVAKKPL